MMVGVLEACRSRVECHVTDWMPAYAGMTFSWYWTDETDIEHIGYREQSEAKVVREEVLS
jgi:hypothetical protein